MGNSIFGIGVSGLLASQQALQTVSHNIANVNNPAYSRQRNELATRQPELLSGSYRGTGVELANIRRSVDGFLVNEVRVGTSGVARVETISDLADQLDNLVASPDAGLSPAIDRFFAAIQDVADDPVSTAPRSVLLSEARSLVQGFDNLDRQFEAIEESVNTRIGQAVAVINDFAVTLANLNDDIGLATGLSTNAQPNDLLDQRDELLRQLSELVDVNVVEQDDQTVTVSIGTGQALVVGSTANQLAVLRNEFEPTRSEVALAGVPGNPVVSQFLSGGELGGLLGSRSELIDPARNILGRVAVAISEEINAQHQQGLDLQGNRGGLFFNDLTVATDAAGSSLNTGTGNVSFQIADLTQLTTSDYRVENNGGTYTVTRLADGTVTNLPGPPSTTTVDGIDFTLSGAIADGDRFLVRPTRFASRDLDTVIGNPQSIAAASLATSAADLGNAGAGTVSAAEVVDPTAFPAPYLGNTLLMADSTAAAAGGGEGVITNGSGNPLSYQVRINGVTVYDQPPDPVLASVNDLANAINASTGATGVEAHVEGGTLFLARDPANAGDIVVTEELVNAGAGDSVTGYFGASLDNATPTTSFTFTAPANSYLVLDDTGTPIQSGTYADGSAIAFNGIEVTVSGTPVSGDTFTVAANTFGVGDNRNALALADLQIADILNGGTSSFQEAYGELVVEVGGEAREASINLAAQQALLDNAVAARAEISGVNLDEEAADLLLFQQSYRAAAQVIATANTLFEELISVARG